jgi:ligand-binding sensor domain-containing protein/AraC-like DNA-binding protein
VFLSENFAMAQQHPYYRLIGAGDGLAGESGGQVTADANGQIWITTTRGVSMYNGKRITSYLLSDGKEIGKHVDDIKIGANHSIYAINNIGMFELRQGSRKFERILTDIGKPHNMLVDGHRIYIGCSQGIVLFDGTKYSFLFRNLMNTERDGVRSMAKDRKGHIWYVSRMTIGCVDAKTGRHLLKRQLPKQLPQRMAMHKICVWGDSAYLGTKNNGMWTFSLKSHTFRPSIVDGKIITSMHMNNEGMLAIGTDGNGAYLYNCRMHRVEKHFGTNEEGAQRLPSDVVYGYSHQVMGVDWFGLSRLGIAYLYREYPIFKTWGLGNYSTEGQVVKCFCFNGADRIIGTTHGLFVATGQSSNVRHITPKELGGAHLPTEISFHHGRYFVCTYDAGLKLINAKTKQQEQQKWSDILNYCSVYLVREAKDSSLWIGTSEGVFVVSHNDKLLHHFTENNSKVSGGQVSGIVFDPHENVWISASTGLSIFLHDNQEFSTSLFPKNFFGKAVNLRFFTGHGGMIYAVCGSQLYYTDSSMQHFGEIRLPEDIVHENCYSFLDDKNGHFWVVTDLGLFRSDYHFKDIVRFSAPEGLRCGYINGVMNDGNGYVWAATDNGLKYAQETELNRWIEQRNNHLLLYNIRIGGELLSGVEENVVNGNGIIKVGWNIMSSELRFSPVLADYADASRRIFEYRVDGRGEWLRSNEATEIVVNDLLLGQHELAIRLAGVSGTERIYRIYTVPSFAAIAEVIFLIILIVAFLVWRRKWANAKDLLIERTHIEEALIDLEHLQQQQDLGETKMEKYYRVKLDDKECKDIHKRLELLLQEEHLYRNPELKRSDLADRLQISTVKMSQFFTQYLKVSYYDYINRYRLEDFKRLVSLDAYHRYTITALSELCGFKKSSFFSTFRNVEGMTPTEYLKKHNINLNM